MTSPSRICRRPRRVWLLGVGVCALAGLAAAPGSRRSGDENLRDPVITEALPLISATNALGLGDEARRIESWIRDHRPPLSLPHGGSRIVDASGEALALSAKTALVLDRLNQWYRLLPAPDHPITTAELKAGALKSASVARIRDLFEKAIARGLRLNGRWITPESGGEATLDGQLHLIETVDNRWRMVQELASAADQGAITSLVESRPDAVAAVDAHGLLKVAAARFRLGAPGAGDEVRRALLTVAQNAAATYEHDPAAQLALIASRDWQGRYVGRWHLHPPHDAGDGWAAAGEPSYEDMQNALVAGQYLTLTFHPEGFDLYDASTLSDTGRIDVSALKVIRYRSARWRTHFARLHGRPPSTRRGRESRPEVPCENP